MTDERLAAIAARDCHCKCPIGLDDTPELCSAGSCVACLVNRLKSREEEIARLRAVMELIAEDAGEYERKVANFPLSIRVGLIAGLTP